jgi:hypothetical protein
MADLIIRAAAREDLPALAALKAEYMRVCYHGLAQAESLLSAGPDTYAAEFAGWLNRENTAIDMLLSENTLESYVVFGRDAEGKGQILEARTRRPEDAEAHCTLLDRVMNQLRAMGCSDVQTWVARSNYRKRFLYESYGFRAGGKSRLDRRAGDCLEMVQYVYSL